MIQAGFDFIDFGCGDGANIARIQSIEPSLRGLGIDIDESKVEKARNKGFTVTNFDILKLPTEKLVQFVTMSHFLEHLPSVKLAEDMIRRGIDISSDFVFIRQPWFDSDGSLLSQNLKFFWSDWGGHPNRMTSLDFYLILRRALNEKVICGFSIFGRSIVRNTADTCIIPLDTPSDQHHYVIEKHGEKNADQELVLPAYKEIVVIAQISSDAKYEKFIAPIDQLYLLKKASS